MRIDKYDPYSGGFRAPLAADKGKTDTGVGGARPAVGVGINNLGRVVVGAGQSGIVGVLVLTRDMKAGDVVDAMTAGEVVEFGGAAGTAYVADVATGAIAAGAPDATHVSVGFTVEANRLIVRVGQKDTIV